MHVGDNEKPEQVVQRLDTELEVASWWTPLNAERPVTAEPRTDDDGRSVPSWWADDETESQQWLAAQGVMLS